MKMMVRMVALLLWATGMAAAQTAPVSGSGYPTKFEIASVRMLNRNEGDGITNPISKPGSLLFTAHSVPLLVLVQYAYGVPMDHVEGWPTWMKTTFYDVSARPDANKGPTYEQLKPMLQQLLAQRFHLQTHTEEKEMKGYSLVVAKGGERLTPSKSEAQTDGFRFLPSGLQGSGDLKHFANVLAMYLKQPVRDDSGIQGRFDVKLEVAPPETGLTESPLPSVFTAVQEQLGLKLESAKVQVQMLVIDHADRVPTEN